jgi:hypothetical protein
MLSHKLGKYVFSPDLVVRMLSGIQTEFVYKMVTEQASF